MADTAQIEGFDVRATSDDPDYQNDDTTTTKQPRTAAQSSFKTCNPKVFIIFVVACCSVVLGVILSLIGETTVVYFGISFLALGALMIILSTCLARCWAVNVGEEP